MAKGGTESLLYERCPVAYTTMLSSRVVALTIICLVIKNKNHKSQIFGQVAASFVCTQT